MWIYEGKKITEISQIENILGYTPYGFVYNIVTNEGREYVGQKILFTEQSKVVSKKQLKERGKSAFKRRTIKTGKRKGELQYYTKNKKESNWLSYTGSSKNLNKDISKGLGITKYILKFVKSKSLLNYEEHKQILCTGAMEEDKFYNDYTQIKVFKKNIINKK